MIYCYKTELTLRRVIHLKKTKASCCNGTCDKRQKSSLTTTGLFAARRNLSSLVIQFFSISSPFNKRSATCIFTFGQEKNAIFPPLFDIQHSISYACLSPHQAHDICCGLQHQHLFTRCLNTKVWLRCLENVLEMLTWLTWAFSGVKVELRNYLTCW